MRLPSVRLDHPVRSVHGKIRSLRTRGRHGVVVRNGHRYDWKRDLRPHAGARIFMAEPPAAIAPSSDLRPLMGPVFDQGAVGSCTANALAAAVEFLQLRELKEPGQGRQEFDPNAYSPASRLFIYWNEREREGMQLEDSGGFLRDGISSLATLGVCEEKIWQYNYGNVFTRPSAEAYEEAKRFTIASYAQCPTLTEVRAALSAGLPVPFGFDVYQNFESEQCARTGELQVPFPNEAILGGHAVCAVGHDDAKRFLWVRNSWGPGWGVAGYFKMPYDYFERGWATDAWVVRG